jgi:hypothetical protein
VHASNADQAEAFNIFSSLNPFRFFPPPSHDYSCLTDVLGYTQVVNAQAGRLLSSDAEDASLCMLDGINTQAGL